MEDSYRHKGMRRRLVNEIRKKGILDEAILEAIYRVPRHLFLDSGFLNHAYDDKPFPIGSGQTISQPYTVAFQTELLQVQPGDRILEIGTGSGYQACVLAALGAEVYSVERQKKLYEKARVFLPQIGFQVHLFYGDGSLGLPEYAPFDGILITAAAPEIPNCLFEQLKTGGVLVSPLGAGEIQTMVRFTKLKNGKLKEERFGKFRFVPLLKNKADD
jgi:protein-L-isoaspartate(D-aspartate) O-methyltransferase